MKDEIEASHDGDEPKNGVLKSAASSLEPDRKRSRRSRAEEDEAVVDGAKEPKEKAEAGLKDLKAEAGKESGADNDDGAPDESSKARKPRSRPRCQTIFRDRFFWHVKRSWPTGQPVLDSDIRHSPAPIVVASSSE